MRQPTIPFVVERKPSREPRPDTETPSIWGRLGADISQVSRPGGYGSAGRHRWCRPDLIKFARVGSRRPLEFIGLRLQRMQERHRTLRMRRRLEDGPPVTGKHR